MIPEAKENMWCVKDYQSFSQSSRPFSPQIFMAYSVLGTAEKNDQDRPGPWPCALYEDY